MAAGPKEHNVKQALERLQVLKVSLHGSKCVYDSHHISSL